MKTYQSKYAFLAAINNNLFKEYMTLLSQYTDLLKQYSSFDLFPLCLRINTDFNIFTNMLTYISMKQDIM